MRAQGTESRSSRASQAWQEVLLLHTLCWTKLLQLLRAWWPQLFPVFALLHIMAKALLSSGRFSYGSCHFLSVVTGLSHSWVKFKIPAKNEIQKIRENDGSYLFLQRFDKFLIWNTQWPETEAIWICWNLDGKTREITLGELIFGGF